MIRLSVIIPTFNRCALVLQTLASLARQSLSPNEFEVIVVVDGSTDATFEQVTRMHPDFALQVIRQENCGQSVARNVGATAARSPVLLFLDDDLVCDSQLLDAHLRAANANPEAVVFGPVYLHPDCKLSVPAESYRRYAEGRFGSLQTRGARFPDDAMLAANSSIPTRIFQQAGGYDTAFARCEDIEFGYRLWHSGVPFVFAADARAWQQYDKSAHGLIYGDAMQFGSSELQLCRSHPEHRACSALAHFVNARGFRRLAAKLVATLPFSPQPLLSPFYTVIAFLPFPVCRTAAIRFLQMRQGVAALRSASAYAGGWRKLSDELST